MHVDNETDLLQEFFCPLTIYYLWLCFRGVICRCDQRFLLVVEFLSAVLFRREKLLFLVASGLRPTFLVNLSNFDSLVGSRHVWNYRRSMIYGC